MHARQYVWPEPRSDTGSTNGSVQIEQHILSSSAFEYSAFRRWRFVGRSASAILSWQQVGQPHGRSALGDERWRRWGSYANAEAVQIACLGPALAFKIDSLLVSYRR